MCKNIEKILEYVKLAIKSVTNVRVYRTAHGLKTKRAHNNIDRFVYRVQYEIIYSVAIPNKIVLNILINRLLCALSYILLNIIINIVLNIKIICVNR